MTHVFDATSAVDVERIEPGLRHHFPLDPEGRLTGPAFPFLR